MTSPTENSSVVPASLPLRSSRPLLLLFISLVLVAAIITGLWFAKIRTISPFIDTEHQLIAAGFNPPVSHKLGNAFTDADGDLIADVPPDSAKCIDPPRLGFCYVATDDVETNKKNWQPLVDYLSKMTGKPVDYVMVTSTLDQLKAMRDGKLQIAGFNTGSVPTAVNRCGFVPICDIPTSDGLARTHTDIIVPADSDIQKPMDLKGRELTVTDLSSNSGYKAPLVLLRANFGLQPSSDLPLRFSDSHDTSIAGIASHKYGAAAVADDMLSRQIASGGIKTSQFRNIYQTEAFPTASLGYLYNLKPALAKKVRDALLSFNWKGTGLEAALNSNQKTMFMPINYKDDFSLIRRIDDEMGAEYPF